MPRLPSVILLGALALGSLALVPAAEVPTTDQESDPAVCVRFRDWQVPLTGITIEKPGDRFCVEVFLPVDDA